MIKKFNKYNDSLRDKMTPKSDDDIYSILSNMSIVKRMGYIKKYELSNKFYPSNDEILKYVSELDTVNKIRFVSDLNLPDKFYPLDKDVIKIIQTTSDYSQLTYIFITRNQLKYIKMMKKIYKNELQMEKYQHWLDNSVEYALKKGKKDMFEYFLQQGANIVLSNSRLDVYISPTKKRELIEIYYKYKKVDEKLDKSITKIREEFINEGLIDKMTPKSDLAISKAIDDNYKKLVMLIKNNNPELDMLDIHYYFKFVWKDILELLMDGWNINDIYDEYEHKVINYIVGSKDEEDDDYAQYFE